MRRRNRLGITALSAFAIMGVLCRLMIGREALSGGPGIEWPAGAILSLRCGAVTSAVLGGACLGLSGLLLQALLRNPLAAPFILGLSAGAGLATVAASWMLAAAGAAAPIWLSTLVRGADGVLPGCVGAVGVLAVVYMLGRRAGRLDPLTLVLTGTVVSTICGALTLLIHSLMPPQSRGESWLWFMGQVPEMPSSAAVWVGAAVLALSLAIGTRLGRALDVASTSDDEAQSLGVSLSRIRVILFVSAGALASVSVAICGPISFVGFVAPHLCRQLCWTRHTGLVIASALAGAGLLVWADALRQVVDLGAGRLPIGVVTALLGGPVFLLVMRSSRAIERERAC